jgi:hypothetical protein
MPSLSMTALRARRSTSQASSVSWMRRGPLASSLGSTRSSASVRKVRVLFKILRGHLSTSARAMAGCVRAYGCSEVQEDGEQEHKREAEREQSEQEQARAACKPVLASGGGDDMSMDSDVVHQNGRASSGCKCVQTSE